MHRRLPDGKVVPIPRAELDSDPARTTERQQSIDRQSRRDAALAPIGDEVVELAALRAEINALKAFLRGD